MFVGLHIQKNKMKVWKDKEGNKLTAKEFNQRFKEGLKNITPKQKLKNDLFSNFVSFTGFIMGLVALIIFRKELIVSWFAWGLILIFLGSSWSTGTKLLMLYQQLKMFKETDINSIDLKGIFDKLENKKEGVKDD